MRWLLLLCVSLVSASWADEAKPEVVPPPHHELELSIKYGPVLHPEHTFRFGTSANQPFLEQQKDDKGGFVIVSGMVQPPQDGVYIMVLTVVDWHSPQNNSCEAARLDLKIGEPDTFGSIGGGVLNMTSVVLSKAVEAAR